jgi:hypothetical protein
VALRTYKAIGHGFETGGAIRFRKRTNDRRLTDVYRVVEDIQR